MKTFRIKLGDLRKFIREVYECGDMKTEMGGHIYNAGSAGAGESTGRTPMAETDHGPSWPYSWPKPKNKEQLNAIRALEGYLDHEYLKGAKLVKLVNDSSFSGVVAVRIINTSNPNVDHQKDFIIYNCDKNCTEDDIEEVIFKSWPPNTGKFGGVGER